MNEFWTTDTFCYVLSDGSKILAQMQNAGQS